MTHSDQRWVCCQIGRREHYGVPRALHRQGALAELITDVWAGGVLATVAGRRARDRFHEDLRTASVWAPNAASLVFETQLKALRHTGWDAMLRRNEWFQSVAASRIDELAQTSDGPRLCFAYSYAAAGVFAAAKAHGWTTVLGQIDPGPAEERLVAALHRRAPDLEPDWRPAPEKYWDSWREECELADRIIVNSAWSRHALCEAGIPTAKIRVVPLAYEYRWSTKPPRAEAIAERQSLRVLFLGQVTLRKGIGELLEAVELLRGEPVQFTVAGPVLMRLPPAAVQHPLITWLGSVPGADIPRLLSQADVLILPTHSDGFGLTQLEALGQHVPVIASAHCGRVVEDGVNGIVLTEVSGAAITAAIRRLLDDPALLQSMQRNAAVKFEYSLAAIAAALMDAAA
jgi:glycosyltransferase involved in cell wall biosynthesis